MSSQDVRWVMVDGREVIAAGRLLTVDEAAIEHLVEDALGSEVPDDRDQSLFTDLAEKVRQYYGSGVPELEPFYALNGR